MAVAGVQKWVNLITPVTANSFNTTGGAGTPINVDKSSFVPYVLGPGNLPVPLSLPSAATIAALQALPPGTNLIYLYAAGMEGFFQWTPSNISTFVTNDPLHALFIPPTTDTTGAHGGWIRQFTGAAESTWWGVSTAAVDNAPAFTSALATLKFLATAGYGYNIGSIGLHTPAGIYTFNATITPDHALEIFGDYQGAGGGTVFLWTSNTSGFFTGIGTGVHANGVHIHNLVLAGTNAGSNCHAIEQHGNARIAQIYVKNWSGNGIDATNDTSGSRWSNILGDNVGWVLHVDGADTNACIGENISAGAVRFGGIYDSSGIGNVYTGGDINQCGLIAGFPTRCSFGGNIYTVFFGQEVWCSTNAPTGTTANNQGWIYFGAGAPSSTAPAWSSGLTWYSAAPILVEPTDGNVRSVFNGMYVEAGLSPIILSDLSFLVGGQILVPVLNQFGTKHGGYIACNRYYVQFNNGIQCLGPNAAIFQQNQMFLGLGTGPAADTELQLNNSNSNNVISFYNLGTFVGQLWSAGSNFFHDFDTTFWRTRGGGGGTLLAQLSTSGLVVSVAVLANKLGGVGYASGAGGSATQPTSKTTGFTINKDCAQFTTSNSALAAAAIATFTITDSEVVSTDTIILNMKGGPTTGNYRYWIEAVLNGSFLVTIENRSAGSLSEALTFNYAVIKAVNV